MWAVLLFAASLLSPRLVSAAPQTVPGRLLVKPRAEVTDEEFAGHLRQHGATHRATVGHSRIKVVAVDPAKTETILARLRQDPAVEFAEPDYVAHAAFVPDDPYVTSGEEWHLAKIQAPQAWDLTTGSSNVIVAVLDSGADATQPDLANQLVPGYNFVANTADTSDDFGHGTLVSGTVAASGNNGIGVAGVAYGCLVMPVKVVDAYGSATHSAIAQGIQYAVDHGVRILNLSLSGDANSQTLQDAINYAWSHNAVVVAAAGNTGGSIPQYPAACSNVVAVSATASDDTLASFSSYGPDITLAAPGVQIVTTQADTNNPYIAGSGTSFACPIVSAVAALVLSENYNLSNEQVVEILKHTADDIGAPGVDTSFGYGRVNAFRAASAAALQVPEAMMAAPASGGTYAIGSTVALSATARPDTVTEVDFLANGGLIGTSPAPSFTYNWTPALPGVYSVVAVAVDSRGLFATSAPISLTVVSPEQVPPTLRLLSAPGNRARLTNAVVNLSGMAHDNTAVQRVEVIVNNGPAVVATGTSNWSAQVTLTPGPNQVRIHSVDVYGNASPDVVRTWTYVVLTPVVVQANGLGTIVPNLNGRWLEIGRTYTVRALPGAGQVFAGWEGTGSLSTLASFIMQSNLVLTADFVPNPFPAVRGNFTGLVANTNGVTPDTSGYFQVTVGTFGGFSGQLQLAGARYSLHGQFNLSGDGSVTINRATQVPLLLTLHVDLTNGTDQISGTLTDGNWFSQAAGDRNVFNTQLNPAAQAGQHAFVLDQASNPSVVAATGMGRIGPGGQAVVGGKLSDKRHFNVNSTLAKNGDFPFYLSLSKGSEVVIGWMNFPADAGQAPAGSVMWVSTGTNAFATALQVGP